MRRSPLPSPVLVAVTFLLVCASAVAMLIVALLTLFQARGLYAERMPAWIGRTSLRLWGVRMVVKREAEIPPGQVIYISNHSSTIDAFALIALALPRTRFFMAGSVRKFPPVALIGQLTRIFWTVPQKYPERRRAIFRRADRILRRSGDSVYLSPEGMRVADGTIGRFNKGAFHLAISLGAPIVPMYIRIPPETDPGRGYHAAPGIVEVTFMAPIDTRNWRLEDLERHRDDVHALYVAMHERMRAPAGTPVREMEMAV